MDNNKKFQKATIAYIITGVLSKGITILTMPLFTKWLSLDEMGTVTTFNSWLIIFYAVVSLSLASGSVNVAMVEFKNNRNSYLSSVLSFSTVTALVASALFLCCRDVWVKITTLPTHFIIVFALYFIFQPALDLWYAKNRYENKYILVSCVTVIAALSAGVISILAIYIFKDYSEIDLSSILIVSQYGVGIVVAGIVYFAVLLKGKKTFDYAIWKWAFLISWPLVIHSVSKNILDISDRLMISSFRGKAEAGLYGTVYTICNMPLIVWGAINNAIIPLTFQMLEQKREESLSITLEKVILIFGIMIYGATLLSPEILRVLVDKKYYETVYIMPCLFLGIFYTAIYNIYGNLLLYKKKTKLIMGGTLIAVITNVLLNFFLIKRFGYKAAAYTTFIACAVLCISQYGMCLYTYQKNILRLRIIVPIVISVTVASLCSVFLYDLLLIRYFLVIVVCGVIVYVYRKKEIGGEK